MRIPLPGWLVFLACCAPCHWAHADASEAEHPSSPPNANEVPPHDDRTHERIVGNHRFVPFRVVPWAIVTTRFSMVTSFGSFSQDVANRTLSQLAFRESFTVQGAVSRWLGIEAELLGAVASGNNARSVFDTGVNYAWGGRLGGVVRLLEGDRFQFSARMDVDLLRLGTTVPRRLLETVQVEDGQLQVQLPELFVPADLIRLRPSLALALAASRVFGIQAGLGFRYLSVWSDGDHIDAPILDLALGASLDFSSLGAPFVVLVGGRLLQDLSAPEERPLISALGARSRTRSELELAMYYSARTALDLGLAFTSDLGGQDRSLVGNIVMTYYW
jgi:hypothetical protein